MSDTSTHHGFNERLSALRPTSPPPDARSERSQGSRIPIELSLGILTKGVVRPSGAQPDGSIRT